MNISTSVITAETQPEDHPVQLFEVGSLIVVTRHDVHPKLVGKVVLRTYSSIVFLEDPGLTWEAPTSWKHVAIYDNFRGRALPVGSQVIITATGDGAPKQA